VLCSRCGEIGRHTKNDCIRLLSAQVEVLRTAHILQERRLEAYEAKPSTLATDIGNQVLKRRAGALGLN